MFLLCHGISVESLGRRCMLGQQAWMIRQSLVEFSIVSMHSTAKSHQKLLCQRLIGIFPLVSFWHFFWNTENSEVHDVSCTHRGLPWQVQHEDWKLWIRRKCPTGAEGHISQWQAFDVMFFLLPSTPKDLQVFDLKTDVRTLREQLACF